jgi:hypothetical protein
MSALINIADFYELQHSQREEMVNQVAELNNISLKYGLILSESQINDLIETRSNALRDNGRIETSLGAVKKIIENFCSSSYINSENYAEVINDLLEIFYFYKTESHDSISDTELIEIMRDQFENKYHGSISLMQGKGFRFMKDYNKDPIIAGDYDDIGQNPDIGENVDYIWDENDAEE